MTGMRTLCSLLLASACLAQRQPLQPACISQSKDAAAANRQALDAHLKRSLTEASEAYDRVLVAEPPREPTAAETALLQRFAPRLFVTASEPFPLSDFAAILHPRAPWIAYHMFWEDDIDFPDDNDPCDHELLWVRLDPSRQHVVDVYTYFHGRIMHGVKEAIEDAGRNRGRVAVYVQWGKHGSMPLGWEKLTITADTGDVERKQLGLGDMPLEAYNRATFEKLSTEGRRAQQSPLGRGWPLRFEGRWEDFSRFPKLIDPVPALARKRLMRVSAWNHAVLNRHLLRYNFSAKAEWPEALCADLQPRP